MLNRVRQSFIEWNVFPSEDQEHPSSNPDLKQLREQRIATRVYIILFSTVLFILVMFTLLNWQTKFVTIYNPSLKIYQQLQTEHSATLNCPCSTITIPYKNFILIKTVLHQICSSIYISREWITALYIPDASLYGAIDFRTTASSQFGLLETLCTLARVQIFDALFDLNNTQILTTHVLSKKEVDIQIQVKSERIRIDSSVRFNDALKLIELSTRSNHISTALNTNYVIGVFSFRNFTSYGWKNSYTSWYTTINNQITICHCEQNTCSFPAGFYRFYDVDDFDIYKCIETQMHNISDFAPGFVGSCTPLEAVLQASFICLYDIECIRKLAQYFPRLVHLIPTIITLNASISSQYPLDVNVSRLIEQLFLEQWTISIDYDQYYIQCAPKICTYSYTKRADFVYMITLLISLCGGLQAIMRFFIPPIVNFIMKKKRPAAIDRVTSITTIEISIRRQITENLLTFFGSIKTSLINLNLFKTTDQSFETIRHQRLSTRIFLCLLIGALCILLLFTTISEQTTSMTFQRPSYTIYKQLYMKYSDKLICSCSEITPSYSSFINITPVYHPVCSSAFIEQIWFDQLKLVKHPEIGGIFMTDWRIMSLGYFQSLAALCKLARDTITHDLHEFHARSLVTTQLLNEGLFDSEMNDILEELIHSIQTEFQRVLNILRLLFQVNQYFTGSTYNGYLSILRQTNDGHLKVNFLFNGPIYSKEKPMCLCAFRLDCEEPMLIIHNNTKFIVPGFVWRCSSMDSILQSTLECLYSNTYCLTDILLRYINYTATAVPVPPLNISDLIRTSSNSTVATLTDNIFIEEWKSSISYINYYQNCAPSTCQYTYIERANYFYMVTVFLAVYGGLTLSLSLLVPLIVKLILRHRNQSLSTVDQGVERLSNVARFRIFYQNLPEVIRTKIIHFNLFETYSFSKHIDRSTRIWLGCLSTRLYTCLYVIGLIVLALYTSIQQRTLTTKIYNPSLLIAQQLQTKYIDTVECPCTKTSISFDEFIDIQTHFHQVCTSTFVTDEWREALTTDLTNMSYFLSIQDYRPYFSAHLQFLSGLCHHAMKHVNDTVRSFFSNSFVTSRLLSQSSFDTQLSALLYQTEANTPTGFSRALQLAQAINYGNTLMSVYGSNYEFVARQNRTVPSTVLHTQPVTYYGTTNCSCGLQSKCLTQAAFTWPSYVAVKGLLIGCLPSESFFASTLECFFDIACIDLIRQHMPGDIIYTHARPLNMSGTVHSRYEINTTVSDLVAKLFMEEWSTKVYYDRYFAQCAPNICSYSYIDNVNPLYVATTLLGLYGGLAVVLSWLSPKIIKLARRARICYRKRRQIRVKPSVT